MRFSVATLTALLMVVSSPTTNVSAQSVSSLVLVDVSKGDIRDVMVLQDGDLIDTTEHGTELSVRAEMQGGGCLEFDLDDGATKRIETAAPYYLAGKDMETGETADYSYRLASNGEHTLKVCPSQTCSLFGSQASRQAEAEQGCLTITFETSDGSAGAFFPFPDVANYDVEAVQADTFGILTGDLLKWHTIALGLAGPPASEMGNTVPGAYQAPSTFADYRLDCTFTHGDGTTYVVPGFYAGNGRVANDRTIGGNFWQCNFVPDRSGEWSYSTVYKQGTNVAQNGGGNPGGFFDGRTGTFTVADVDAETLSDRDFRAKGRLSVANNGHWQFTEGGDSLLKIGPDSPQNVMAYADFDFATQDGMEQPYLKSFVTHEDDYVDGQTTWAQGKGTGLIGAINYLSAQGMNVMSLMTLNLDGDDGSIFPFVHANPIGEENNFLQYDISKLAQWDVVMSHAEKMGVALHIKLGGDASEESVDGSALNENMKLYLREMVARYGHHLAIVWDLGEDISVGYAAARSAEIKRLDPYQNPVAVSTTSATVQQALANIPHIDSVTLRSTETITSVNSHVAAYSAVDGLVVQSVEVGTGVDTDGGDPDHDTVRQESLWGALMAGSAGVQFYFGTSFLESDLTLQDFRSRANLWEQAGYALEFFNMIPFQDMTPQNDLVSEGSYCLADAAKQTIAIYKKKGASMPSVDLSGTSGTFEVLFYSPTEGGDPISGGSIEGGSLQPIPSTPEAYDDDGDWAILVKSA